VSVEPEPEPPADPEHADSEHHGSEHADSADDVFEQPAEAAEVTVEAERAAETSAESEAEELSEPVTDQGAEALGDVPAEPAAEESVDPEVDQPTDAASAGANDPVADQSGESTGDGPADAVAEGPAEPEAEQDAESGAEGSAVPQAEESGEPANEKRAQPAEDGPAEPQAEEGAEPTGDAPAPDEAGEGAESVAGEAGTAADEGAEPAADDAQPAGEDDAEPSADEAEPSVDDPESGAEEAAEAGAGAAAVAGPADPPAADDAQSDTAARVKAGTGEGVEAPDVVLTDSEAAEQAATEQAAMALITALMRLRGALASSKLPIDVVGADEARQQQKEMLDQLDDYILPRLVQLEAPVLAVVGGSTGAGKSTLVNSLIGQVVSEPGVLRPTTRSPVLIHNPVDAEWFTGDRVLPGMARSSGDKPGGTEDPGQIRLVAADTVPQGLAILDAPDIDSVVEANRELATQLLAAADLWLFVTTAARYADAVPWDFLQSASDRSTAVAVVLDRAPADTIDDITGHLAQMLLERGLGDSPLFSIKETVVDGNGMLPPEIVASIKDWLIDLAADAEARTAVVRRTLHGAVTAMTKKTPAFATAVRAQADTIVELRSNAEAAYDRAVKDVAKATQDGTMLRGEVLARWQEFVGTGELLKGLQTNVGRVRDKVKAAVVGKPPPTRDLNDAVESGLESLLREHAEEAAERAEESWQSLAAGRQLLASGDRDMGRMSKEFPAAAAKAVRDWQGNVLDLVRKEGADKRSTARILAYGVNGLGLALMIVIFASTAGITGAEVGVGAGTAVVGQKLLEAVFGDQAVRSLARKAREDLDGRVHALMDAEFARYLAVLDQHPVDPDAPRRLTEAARAVEDCT
jgi:energy-coupling factor transporter ATP-binding protein EcfA2